MQGMAEGRAGVAHSGGCPAPGPCHFLYCREFSKAQILVHVFSA